MEHVIEEALKTTLQRDPSIESKLIDVFIYILMNNTKLKDADLLRLFMGSGILQNDNRSRLGALRLLAGAGAGVGSDNSNLVGLMNRLLQPGSSTFGTKRKKRNKRIKRRRSRTHKHIIVFS